MNFYLAKITLDQVENFVLISTDKAVKPKFNGATKRVSELILQAIAKENKNTNFVIRFGNVLDRLTVVPIKNQILNGGP